MTTESMINYDEIEPLFDSQFKAEERQNVVNTETEKEFPKVNYNLGRPLKSNKPREHFCEICPKAFCNVSTLNAHRKSHFDNTEFPCLICGSKYRTKHGLIGHIKQVHNGEKSSTFCDECGKSFTNIREHKLTHRSSQEFLPCDVCGKQFNRKKHLVRHMVIHTNAAKDTSSPNIFTNSFKLEALKKVKEVGLMEAAKQISVHPSTLSNWRNIANADYSCDFCGKTYPSSRSLKNHISKAHEGDRESTVNMYDDELKHEVVQFALSSSNREAARKYNVNEKSVREWIQKEKDIESGKAVPVKCQPRQSYIKKEYDEKTKQEVVAFTLETSRMAAVAKFNVPYPTVRMWEMQSKGLAYMKSKKTGEFTPTEFQRFQGSLQDFLRDSNEQLNLSAEPEQKGILDPKYSNLLLNITKNFTGDELTQELDRLKTLSEEELDIMMETEKYQGKDKRGNYSKRDTSKYFVDDEEEDSPSSPNSKTEQFDSDGEQSPMEIKEDIKEEVKDDFFDNEASNYVAIEMNSAEVSAEDDESEIEHKYKEKQEVKDEVTNKPFGDIEDLKNEEDTDDDDDENDNDDDVVTFDYGHNMDDEDKFTDDESDKKEVLVKECDEPMDTKPIIEAPEEKSVDIKEGANCCSWCSKQFKHKKHLKRHIALSHTEYTEFQKELLKELKAQRKAMKTKEKQPCTICGSKFERLNDLMRHILTHTGVTRETPKKNMRCEECDIKFATTPALDYHRYKVHEAELPFTCEQCGTGLLTKQSLDKHLRSVHSDETPFSCEHCGKGFKLKERLVAHACPAIKTLVKYGGLKDHRKSMCEECGKELSCKLTLARHMKIHREDNGTWEPCMECDKQYRTKRALNDHIAIIHRGQKNYACNECGKAFGRQNNLIDHVKRKHATPISPSYIAQLEKSTAWLRDNGTFGQVDPSRIPEYTLPRQNDTVMQFTETEGSGGSSQDWRGIQHPPPPPTSSHCTYPGDGNVGTTQSPIL